MRTTRSRAIASHCIIVKVPVEIVTQILKYANIQASDLAAVAATCRYLRAIASPLLLQTISFVGDKKSSFAPLEALVGNAGKGALVRSLIVQEPKVTIASNRAVIYSNILGQALDVLVHLSSLSIPFALLNPTVFTKIYTSSSIETLSISPIHSAQNSLDLSSRVALPARQKALVVKSLETRPIGSSSSIFTTFISNLLDFLTFHSIEVPTITLQHYFTHSSFGSFLTSNPFAALREVDLTLVPTSFTTCVEWLTRVAAAQPSLETIIYSVINYHIGFELGRATWPWWVHGALVTPPPALDKAWSGMMVRRLKLELNRRTASEDFIISDIQIVLPPGAKLTPLHLRTLTTTEPCVFTLTLTSDDSFTDLDLGLSWTNWRKSVEIFISQNFLQALFLNDSVTPSPTVSTTIACSPACYDSLLETHPALHAASELVGGFVAVWNLALNVNLQRLRMLADSKQKYVLDVFWTIFGKNGIIVDYEGTGKEAEEGVVGSEREISFVDRVGSTRTVEEKIRDCQCFECGGGTFQDPISVVRRCGVDTVRAALALGGFDLDAFDARPPTQPVDQDSFETFLRSFT